MEHNHSQQHILIFWWTIKDWAWFMVDISFMEHHQPTSNSCFLVNQRLTMDSWISGKGLCSSTVFSAGIQYRIRRVFAVSSEALYVALHVIFQWQFCEQQNNMFGTSTHIHQNWFFLNGSINCNIFGHVFPFLTDIHTFPDSFADLYIYIPISYPSYLTVCWANSYHITYIYIWYVSIIWLLNLSYTYSLSPLISHNESILDRDIPYYPQMKCSHPWIFISDLDLSSFSRLLAALVFLGAVAALVISVYKTYKPSRSLVRPWVESLKMT